MQFVVIVLTMLILPVASIAAEWLASPDAGLVALAGKWFVFWGIGIRIGLAAVRQIAKPLATSQDILSIADPRAAILARELGFANAGIAAIAILSLALPAWREPAALAGGLFLLLAGVQHGGTAGRNGKQTMAMASDFWMALVAAAYLGARIAGLG